MMTRVFDTAFFEPVNYDPPNPDVAARCRYTEKLAVVSTGPFEAARYLATF